MAKRKQAEAEKTLASIRESIPLLRTQLMEAEAAAAVKLQRANVDPAAIDTDAPEAVRAASAGPWTLFPAVELQRLQQLHTTRLIEESSKIRGAVLLESSLGETHDIEPEDLQEMARITLQDVTLEQVGCLIALDRLSDRLSFRLSDRLSDRDRRDCPLSFLMAAVLRSSAR